MKLNLNWFLNNLALYFFNSCHKYSNVPRKIRNTTSAGNLLLNHSWNRSLVQHRGGGHVRCRVGQRSSSNVRGGGVRGQRGHRSDVSVVGALVHGSSCGVGIGSWSGGHQRGTVGQHTGLGLRLGLGRNRRNGDQGKQADLGGRRVGLELFLEFRIALKNLQSWTFWVRFWWLNNGK